MGAIALGDRDRHREKWAKVIKFLGRETKFDQASQLWVKNGYGGRSTGTSAVPQIADDFGAPRKSAESGHNRTFIASSRTESLPA